MRLLKALGLLVAGVYVGFLGAAALVKRALPSQGDAESDEVALVAIFGGIELASTAKAFRGGSMFAWYGGIAVDLRQATLAPGAKLTASALFGGVAVKVPPGWRIEYTARGIAGGVAVDAPEPDDPKAPTLVVDASAGFGGVAIKAQAADAVES
jgi:hypothetical protein